MNELRAGGRRGKNGVEKKEESEDHEEAKQRRM